MHILKYLLSTFLICLALSVTSCKIPYWSMSKKHAENKKSSPMDSIPSSSIQEPVKLDSATLDSIQAKDLASNEVDTVALRKQKERAKKRKRRIDSLKVVKQERLISSNEKINKKDCEGIRV